MLFFYHMVLYLLIAIIAGILFYILSVHSKYENIILRDVKENDFIPAKITFESEHKKIPKPTTYVVGYVCNVLMEVSFYDEKHVLHACSISEFIQLVGCENLCKKYNKKCGKFDSIIIG